jgi:ribosomal protein S18 acetylase RimI-like enzyme
MNFTIETATQTHLQAIVDFNQKMAIETENKVLEDAVILAGVEAILVDPTKGFYLLAIENNNVLGQLMITKEWSDWRNRHIWWIQSVYVHPEFRKKGVYKSLYKHTTTLAQREGVKEIRLYVEKENKLAQDVYENLGMNESYYKMYEAKL